MSFFRRITVLASIVATAWITPAAAAPSEAAAQVDRTGRQARAARLRAMGRAFLAAGDAGSALAYFRDAIRTDPNDAAAYVALGGIYLDRGSVSDALEVLHAGLRRRPDDPGLWRGLARALEARGEEADAAEALRELVRRAPDDPRAHLARAELAKRRGAWSEALGAYRALVDLAAGGTEVDAETLAEARRSMAALEVLVGTLDPVSGARACEDDSPVRRALAGCTGE